MTASFSVAKKGCSLLACGLFLSACAVTPQEIAPPDVLSAALDDQQLIAESQAPLDGPIDLPTAIARALKYNLAHRVQLMETALANQSFELAKMDMLPILAAEGGVTARNNYDASTSMSVITHERTDDPTTSEDRERFDASVRFSWNVLDFGISYLQAKQEADRYLVTELSRESAMQRMVQEVRTAYWRAAALQTISAELETLMAEAEQARRDLEGVRAAALRPPLAVLEDLRSLAEVIQQLETMQQSVAAAQVDLAALINVPLGDDIPLDIPESLPALPEPPANVDELELMALIESGDYISQLYNMRIEQVETRKALLRLLPGVDIFAGANYDSNSFLYNNTWAEIGARVNWNIMRLLSIDDVMDQNEGREQLAQARRLATNMAVITRFRIAYRNYDMALGQLMRARNIDDIEGEIERVTQQAEGFDYVDGFQRIRSEVRALRSRVAYLIAYADAQDAYGQFIASTGLSPVPSDYQTRTVEQLSYEVQSSFNRWARNEFPLPPQIAEDTTSDAAAEAPDDAETVPAS